MPVSKPGKPVRGSTTGRPIMALLGRRSVLRIGWELREGRTLSFRGLQDACGGISPTVMNQRLRDLREAGFVEMAETDGNRTHRAPLDAPLVLKTRRATRPHSSPKSCTVAWDEG